MNYKKLLTTERLLIFHAIFLMTFNVIAFVRMSGIDFSILYAASSLALQGQPSLVYDVEVHHQTLETVMGTELPYLLGWFYPPHYILMTLPAGLLPFKISLYFFISLTLAAYAFTIYKIAPHPTALLLALSFPGVLMNLNWAQNGFLLASLMGLGLHFIDKRPMIAGLMLGILSFKPQYAILPYLVLLIGRHWKTLFWTTFFSLLLMFTSALILGTEVWFKYIHQIPVIRELIANDWINVNGINVSPYTTIRLFSYDTDLAATIQTLLSFMVVILVIWTWIKARNDYLRNTILTSGIILLSPYILVYDLTLLALPLAFYGWDIYQRGKLPGELQVLIFTFLLPIANTIIVESSGIQITSVAVLVLLAMAIRRLTSLSPVA